MNILHYSLGLYPHRSGGLNRYATDLMMEQSREHNVAILYPCGYRWWRRKCYVSQSSNFGSISVYKMINSHPIPLLFGIRRPGSFVNKDVSIESFTQLYEDFHPEVLHLHTLMGMPEGVLAYFKERGVRIVYTTHDYFGICPKVNLINQSGVACAGPDEKRCMMCNSNAPYPFFLRLRNSSLAFIFRDLVQWIKNMKRF